MPNLVEQRQEEAWSPLVWCKLELASLASCWWGRNTFSYEILSSGPSAVAHFCGTAGAGSISEPLGWRTQERLPH